ncbi:efflux RND transporter periplasmic adaptor subunit [Phenylobacterium terrae]|uniref:Efflux RND transporter periplasmic adaptor subunit n=1 Tax=Phenylobacterium terrae TaxID=2665495 RepID=A0ABW4N0D7_9CAUL
MLAGGIAAALALVAGGAGLVANLKPGVRVPSETVTVAEVRRGVFRDVTAFRGKVAPKDVVYLDVLEGGQVEQVLARSGDVVAAGQPIVRFRNTALELEVLDREGRLVESITQLQAYERQLEDARVAGDKAAARIEYDIVRLSAQLKRRESLAAKGFVSREQHEAVRDELTYAQKLKPLQAAANADQVRLMRRQLPQIQAELASLQESLKITRSKLDQLLLRAPVAGRLADAELTVGQIVNRGARVGQVVPDTGFKVEAQIDEFYLDRVRVGQAGQVEIAGRPWKLKVTRVNPQVKDSVFFVELAFDGSTPPGLLSGQALDGRLFLGADAPGLVLPAGAFLERTGGAWVMVVAPDGRSAERRQVEIGRRNTDEVEVLSGLRAGERVITSDYTAFEKAGRVSLTR